MLLRYFFITLFTFIWCTTIVAQNESERLVKNEVNQITASDNPSAMWDVLYDLSYPEFFGTHFSYGAEYDGTSFYTTIYPFSVIQEIDILGPSLIREFSIPGVTHLFDLAWDGTYMYGGGSTNTIYIMDFENETLIGTIPSTEEVRHIAYDSDNDAFWVGNWVTDIVLIDRTGNELARLPADPVVTSNVGSCYDNVSPGGPYLWVFSLQSGFSAPQYIHQLQLPSGTYTGVSHDVNTDVGENYIFGGAGGLFSMTDFVTGKFTIGGIMQREADLLHPDKIFVYEVADNGSPCPAVAPTNPSPVDGATNVSINLTEITWDNGGGTTSTDVYFGAYGDVPKVYSGSVISSWSIPADLEYNTFYQWRVVSKNDTCTTIGPLWQFATELDPNITQLFSDDFESGSGNWIITNEGGDCVWEVVTPPYPPFPNDYLLPFPSSGGVLSADAYLCGQGTTTITTAILNTALDATNYQFVSIEFDNDWKAPGTPAFANMDVSTNGGASWEIVFSYDETQPARRTHEFWDVSSLVGENQFLIRFLSFQPEWYWHWAIDNIAVYATDIIPVELTSFTASAAGNMIALNWATSTETNNQGFEIERNSGNEFEKIGFVPGFGTTTEPRVYSFSDINLNPGTYSYRLKQVDYDGTFEYSDIIEVEVTVPDVFALEQNYPNPFNPSTKISFSLAVDSKVSLKVFDVLGQEIKTLINSDLTAGSHNIDFNASNLNSGVYFYRIDANGVDGTNFSSVKKMMLMK